MSEMQTGKTTDNTTNSTAQNGTNVNRRIDTKKIVVQSNHYFFHHCDINNPRIFIISQAEKIINRNQLKNLDFFKFYSLIK